MLGKLTPDFFVDSILDLSPQDLRQKGIKGLIIDLDNTITEWNKTVLTPEIWVWFEDIKSSGLKICLVSNNREIPVTSVAKNLEVPAIPNAGKPRRHSFRKAMNIMETSPEHTAVIGDQIFTDILGGNRLGIYTILVSPITRREFLWTRLVRKLEKIVLRKMGKGV